MKNLSLIFDNSSTKATKPVKSKYTVEIASDSQKNVELIPVQAALIVYEELLIGYGGILLKFELIVSCHCISRIT